MRISDWSSDVCSSDLTSGRIANDDDIVRENFRINIVAAPDRFQIINANITLPTDIAKYDNIFKFCEFVGTTCQSDHPHQCGASDDWISPGFIDLAIDRHKHRLGCEKVIRRFEVHRHLRIANITPRKARTNFFRHFIRRLTSSCDSSDHWKGKIPLPRSAEHKSELQSLMRI